MHSDFSDQAREGYESLINYHGAAGEDYYLFMQYSDAEDCWDWTLFDASYNEIDGGQFDSGDETPYDATATFVNEELREFIDGFIEVKEDVELDSDERTEVEFIDPEIYWDEIA